MQVGKGLDLVEHHNRKVDYLELVEHKLRQDNRHPVQPKHPDRGGNGNARDDVHSHVDHLGHTKWPKEVLMEPEIVVKSHLKEYKMQIYNISEIHGSLK